MSETLGSFCALFNAQYPEFINKKTPETPWVS